jgi:hypothetical protein
MFTVWQAVHQKETTTNWISNPNEARADLLPFLKPQSVGDASKKFWSSNLVADCEVLGYTYRDLDKKSTKPVADRFRELYSWSISLTPRAPKATPPDSMKPIPAENSEFFKQPNATRTNLFSLRSVAALPQSLAMHVEKLQVSMTAKLDKVVAWDWYVDDRVQR